MRRRVKSLLKFTLLAAIAILSTVIVFNLVQSSKPGSRNRSNRETNGENHSKFLHIKRPASDEKIDWHNYEQMREDLVRKGVGEQGKAGQLAADDDLNEKEALYKANGFNALLSDKISLTRSVPDIRHAGCKTKKYLAHLNTVSVIVPFHNEHMSTLLRTAYSVVRRSPPDLLKEVILVDDFSNKPFLKDKLDGYVKKHLPKVRVIHLDERVGLIRARLAGAKQAIGEVLVFLDSHTEANVNWLPPLLEPIAEDYKTCVCPFIDVIAFDTFQYRAQDEGQRGAFDWEFFYKRLPLLPEDLKRPTEPFKSPVMAGGLFAISAKFFWELGGYDEGLDIWGGEQYELSFKIWQCGGQMFDAPCSRVGHIYRKFAPFPNPGRGDFVGKNYRRVAEVWMDEYAEYLYKRRPHYRNINPGDLTEQRAVRERLKCKPFKWFMEEVAFDLPLKYPPVEPPDFAQGEIRSMLDESLCVDTEFKKAEQSFGIRPCTKDVKNKGNKGEQNFVLTWHKDIRPKGKTLCWDVSSVDNQAPVNLYACHGMKGNQMWRYDTNTSHLIHGGNPRCLSADIESLTIFVTQCDDNAMQQKWKVEFVNRAAMADWHKIGPT